MTDKATLKALAWTSFDNFNKDSGHILIDESVYDLFEAYSDAVALRGGLEALAKSMGKNLAFRVWNSFEPSLGGHMVNIEWRLDVPGA